MTSLWQRCGLVVSYNDPSADFRAARAGAASDVLVATDAAGAIVGSVMVGHDGHRGWLYYLAAEPALQRRSVGRQLVAAAEAWLRERGVRKLQLMVREGNADVLAFYERLGFEVTPRIVMAKWLDEGP